MSLSFDIQLERIDDEVIRDSLQKLMVVLRENPFFSGNWRVYEEEFKTANSETPIKHNLKFIPKDALLLYIDGNTNFSFKHELFDKDYIYASVGGACRVRFIAGRLGEI